MRGFRWSGLTAWLAVTVIFCCVLLATCRAHGQCPGGVCPNPNWRPSPGVGRLAPSPAWRPSPGAGQPTPAWRYEHAVGHRRAVVRIETSDGAGRYGNTKSLGSGVLLRWGGRIVVLTARHVIRDARAVFVWLATGKRYSARVIAVDAAWDCAVLDIGEPADLDVEPAEFAKSDDPRPKPGERLESCGYGGPDSRLACNVGLFRGYYTRGRGGGPADWMAISGRARNGDSGGPVFNGRGRVVGVLWGTDGAEVMAVQPGRLTVVLNEALARLPARRARAPAVRPPRPVVPQTAAAEGWPPALLPKQFSMESGLGNRPRLPFCRPRNPAPAPSVVVHSDPAIGRTLTSIDGKLDIVIRNTAAPCSEDPNAVKQSAVNPLVAVLIVLASVVFGFVVYFSAQKG